MSDFQEGQGDMGRKLPEPAPRNCAHCQSIFTPIRKKWRQRFCGLVCQRSACLTTKNNAQLSRDTAERRGNALRGRGEGRTYIKQRGKHQHRLVAEQMLGRPLVKGEVVHHKNGDRRDNRPENLEVLTSQSQHLRVHNLERHAAKGGGFFVGRARS